MDNCSAEALQFVAALKDQINERCVTAYGVRIAVARSWVSLPSVTR